MLKFSEYNLITLIILGAVTRVKAVTRFLKYDMAESTSFFT